MDKFNGKFEDSPSRKADSAALGGFSALDANVMGIEHQLSYTNEVVFQNMFVPASLSDAHEADFMRKTNHCLASAIFLPGGDLANLNLHLHGTHKAQTHTAENDPMPPVICSFAALEQGDAVPIEWYRVRSQPSDVVEFLKSRLPVGSFLSRRAPAYGPSIFPTHDGLNNEL
jgi:hypothetical protein